MADPVVIRAAQSDDVDFLVHVMRIAATSHLPHCVWDVLLDLPPDRTDTVLRRVAESEQPHWCHVSRFWIAEADGRPVGAMSGFDTATEGSDVLERELAAQAVVLGLDETALLRVLERGQVLRDGTPADFPGTWGVENVAVAEQNRGTGVVDELFTAVLGHGHERGHDTAQILCLNGNVRAERAWERQGFVVKADYCNQRFLDTYGCLGTKLLLRDL
ncbi:GNAT family N-acetyltransferase [Propioniciclava soli]|uniref:GNAT family N-acetyltransferase n=1 Tax=Propioniciclava soli TaxID=2775081 RepID=A0ABZ3C8C2_9ACTN